MRSFHKLRMAGIVALALAGAGVAGAGSLQIGPTIVTLVGSERTATLTVRNSDSNPVTVQIRPMDWSQTTGEDRLEPSVALVASPPFATLQPGEAQTVRLLIENVPNVKAERAFRLVIDEVPSPVTRTSTGLQTTLRILAPVFLSPSTDARPRLSWKAVRTADGVTLTASNSGSAHEHLSDMQVNVGGAVQQGAQLGGYVLAGGSRSWTLPVSTSADVTVISAAGDYGPVNARVAVAR